ncbi:MAG TPA: DUF364 domain-containing protein [Atribacterota bacterium]|nr:DUF364 domain-containing protein [Atribacterota bacterium]
MLIDAILKEARLYLAGRIIRDAVLGVSLIGIELDNNDIGLSYMLRDHLPAGCSVFGFAQEIIGANAFEVAQLAKEGTDDAQRGVGIAVLAAGTRQLALPDEGKKDACFGVKVEPGDVIGMIGLIPPVAERLAHLAKKLIVFDEGISLEGSGRALAEQIQPMEKQDKLLPECDIVIITGSTFINHSIDHLLEVCKDAREIILVGASTPMYPGAFRSTNVTVLAGSWWDSLQKKELFKKISLAGGISHISGAMIKKAVSISKY